MSKAKPLLERASELLDALLDHDVGYEAQTGAAQIVDDLMAELRRQHAEIEALRKDAERWREWRKGKPLTVEIPTPTEEKPNRRTTVIFGPNHEPNYGETLDAAIDAAMGEKA
jgi:hypothetical protein